MTSIIEFLEARIDEDEERAGSGWSRLGTTRWETNNYGQDHLTPTAVLAECKAKRVIVAEHATQEVASLDSGTWAQPFIVCKRCAVGDRQIVAPCPTTKALAAVYKDHPDYQREWEA